MGLTSLEIHALAVDPAAPLKIYAATGGGGVFDLTQTESDLGITKDNGLTAAIPGDPVSYTITVTNAGPDDAIGARVTDSFPADLTGVMWTCVATGGASCTAGPVAGDIDELVDVPMGDTLTFTATGTLALAATGFLTNTATVAAPPGVSDPDVPDDPFDCTTAAMPPDPSCNFFEDGETIKPTTDLEISKTHVGPVLAGGTVTYTIVATNNGPLAISGAKVADTFPAEVTGGAGVTWICTASGTASCMMGSPTGTGAAGTGDIDEAVDLGAAVGDKVTYTAAAKVASGTTGMVDNTATVDPNTAVTGVSDDVTPGNNSSTDSITLGFEADLSIAKDDGSTAAIPGGHLTDLDLRALAIRPDATSTLLIGTAAGAFKSLDMGGVWSGSSDGLTDLSVRALAIDPLTSDVAYAGTIVIAPCRTVRLFVFVTSMAPALPVPVLVARISPPDEIVALRAENVTIPPAPVPELLLWMLLGLPVSLAPLISASPATVTSTEPPSPSPKVLESILLPFVTLS